MRLLLDTHALLWWLGDDHKLPRRAYDAIADPDNEVLVSTVSAFEIATKTALGKLPEAALVAGDLGPWLDRQGFGVLPLELPVAIRAGFLPGPHRDPFDRLLIAQALVGRARPRVEREGLRRLWRHPPVVSPTPRRRDRDRAGRSPSPPPAHGLVVAAATSVWLKSSPLKSRLARWVLAAA